MKNKLLVKYVSIIMLIISIYLIIDLFFLKDYNFLRANLPGRTISKEKSIDIGMFVCDISATDKNVFQDKHCKLEFINGYIEKRWLHPSLFGKIKKYENEYEYQIVMEMLFENLDYFESEYRIIINKPNKGVFRSKSNDSIVYFYAFIKDTLNFEDLEFKILKENHSKNLRKDSISKQFLFKKKYVKK